MQRAHAGVLENQTTRFLLQLKSNGEYAIGKYLIFYMKHV